MAKVIEGLLMETDVIQPLGWISGIKSDILEN